jgi:hypothetical protein
MGAPGAYLADSRALRWDHLLGLRGWGLILYGALPASLTALGLVRVEPVSLRAELMAPAVLLAAIPVALTYLLVRQRLSSWYVLRWGLGRRTLFVTLATLVMSCLISGAAGLLKGRYRWADASVWMERPQELWMPVVESTLTGAVLLVGSTTLFLTAVKESGGLPALPSQEAVTTLASLRTKLAALREAKVWAAAVAGDDLAAVNTDITDAIKSSRQLIACSAAFQRALFTALIADLEGLQRAAELTSKAAPRWLQFFGNGGGALNQQEQVTRGAVDRLRELLSHGR